MAMLGRLSKNTGKEPLTLTKKRLWPVIFVGTDFYSPVMNYLYALTRHWPQALIMETMRISS
jgi:hypothetical protein